MANTLEPISKDLTFEKFTITSLEKLDNNYIHIIGQGEYSDINVITNGIFTLDFSNFSKAKKIVSYNGIDYLIAENDYNELFLISLNDGTRLITKAKELNYIDDGLFNVGNKKSFSAEEVYDLNTNDYIPFPDNMVFSDYKDGVLTLQASDKKTQQEMIIDRNGNVIISRIDDRIRIIDNTKFMTSNMIIDLNQNVIVQDADLIMPLTDDKIIILKTENYLF